MTLENNPNSYKRLKTEWWKEEDWILPPYKNDIEPSIFKIIKDFVENKIIQNNKCLKQSKKNKLQVITFEVEHPDEDEYIFQYTHILLNPIQVRDGVPDSTPDVILHIDYYDLIRILKGEIDLINILMVKRGYLIGDVSPISNFKDIIDISNQRDTKK